MRSILNPYLLINSLVWFIVAKRMYEAVFFLLLEIAVPTVHKILKTVF